MVMKTVRYRLCRGVRAGTVAMAILGAGAGTAAADARLPITMRLADAGMARCSFEIIVRKGNGAVISETSGNRETKLSPTLLTTTLGLEKEGRATLEYTRDGDVVSRPPRVSLSGSRLSKVSEAEKQQIRQMLSFVPTMEAFLAGRRLEAGDPLFSEEVASMIDSVVKMALPNAQQKSLDNEVFVRDVRDVDGRPTVFGDGVLNVQYVARGKWLSMKLTGAYSVDVGTGLVRQSQVSMEGRVDTQVFLRQTEDMTCRIEGPAATTSAAADAGSPALLDDGDARSRLEALDKLLNDGLITQDEAARKRSEILEDL